MQIAVAQLGARMHYAVPRIFEEAGILDRLFTDTYVGNKTWLQYCLKTFPTTWRPKAIERWLGRQESHIPPDKVTSFDIYGIVGSLEYNLLKSESARNHFFEKYGRGFNRRILAHGLGEIDSVWGFTGGAADLFKEAKRRGIRCIFEQFDITRAEARSIRNEEQARWPNWQLGLQTSSDPGSDQNPLVSLEREEISLADTVVVASPHTRMSLASAGYSVDCVVEVPYGIDHSRFFPTKGKQEKQGGPLTILYAGYVDLRKGVPYLLEAIRQLKSANIRCVVAGAIWLDQRKLEPYRQFVDFLGPVPRASIPELFRQADIFVFPTLGEGFGVVQIEAIASGVPVIATNKCGAVVRDGVDGHVVPARDPVSIAHWLDYYASNPTALSKLRKNAIERAKYFDVHNYGQRLLSAIKT